VLTSTLLISNVYLLQQSVTKMLTNLSSDEKESVKKKKDKSKEECVEKKNKKSKEPAHGSISILKKRKRLAWQNSTLLTFLSNFCNKMIHYFYCMYLLDHC
jgi:hypothetical protein